MTVKTLSLSAPPTTISREGHDKKSTPGRRCNANARGPRRPAKGHDRLVTSLPHPADTPPPPSAALADGCPECVLNVEPPIDIRPTGSSVRATYICTDCGHAWATDWRA